MLKEHENDIDAWAYAREGQLSEAGEYVDVLTIEAKAHGMPESIIFVQRFQPYATGRFKLIGEPIVSIGGKLVSPEEAKQLIAQLRLGVQSHGKAAALWNEWISPSEVFTHQK